MNQDNKKIEVWAHRGASGYAPENTLDSFILAQKMGADGIELDVQLTKDGEIVVVHDEVLERVSDGTGYVKDHTLVELKKLNFSKVMPGYQETKIPTLSEVLTLLKNSNMLINIELKTGIFFYQGIEEKIIQLVKEMEMEDRIWYSSFNHYTIKTIQKLNPTAKVGLLFMDVMIDLPKYAKNLEVDAIHPGLFHAQVPGLIEKAQNLDLKVHIWTVNEKSYMEMMCQLQVESIITNYPDVCLEIVRKYQSNNSLKEK